MKTEHEVKAATRLIIAITVSFILVPVIVAVIIVEVLSSNFGAAFGGAIIGSALYRFGFDQEFKDDFKTVWRWWLYTNCHNADERKSLDDAFKFEEWMNQQPEKPLKEQTLKEKLNKSILDD